MHVSDIRNLLIHIFGRDIAAIIVKYLLNENLFIMTKKIKNNGFRIYKNTQILNFITPYFINVAYFIPKKIQYGKYGRFGKQVFHTTSGVSPECIEFIRNLENECKWAINLLNKNLFLASRIKTTCIKCKINLFPCDNQSIDLPHNADWSGGSLINIKQCQNSERIFSVSEVYYDITLKISSISITNKLCRLNICVVNNG
jgi:hypothetical protein